MLYYGQARFPVPIPHALSKRKNLNPYPETFQIAKLCGPNVRFWDRKSAIWTWIFHKFTKEFLFIKEESFVSTLYMYYS